MSIREELEKTEKRGIVWDEGRNADLDPEGLTPGSHREAWWLCDKGHSWQARVFSVTLGESGCPYCAGKKVIPGETDLASTHPEVLDLWCAERNDVLPDAVLPGSEKKVWWRCKRGHQWQAKIFSVALDGNRCPYCAGIKATPGINDVATLHPRLMAQWDYEKNKLDPGELLPSSHAKVWWRCEKGHSWEAVTYARTKENGTGCPYCSGRRAIPGETDLATLRPELAKEWHDELNGPLKPENVSLGCNKRVWWRCDKGHVWQTAVFARTKKNGSGCPVCVGKARPKRLSYCESRRPVRAGEESKQQRV